MNNLGRSESSIDRIVNFCKKNATYMSRGFLTAALVVALAVTVTGCKGGDDQKSKKPQTEQDGQQSDEKNAGDGEDKSEDQAEDSQSADAKIQELFSTYYNSYAAGDVDKLSNVTKYLSDMEKDYIQMMHKNVDSYDNVSCTVEEGNKKGSYMVSVVYDMKFSGAKEALPGLNVFYVQTDKEGQLYINNRYSSFNRELKEQKMNKKILKLIKEFEGGDKIQALNDEVQDKYDKIIEDDNKLKKKVEFICSFCNINSTIMKGNIRKINKTNLNYIEPHRIIIKGITFLAFNYSNEIFVENLSKSIKLSDLETYIKQIN